MMAPSFFTLFISMLLLGAVTCYGPEVGSRMLVENFTSTAPSIPTGKVGTHNFMISVFPSIPTSKDGTRNFMSVILSTPISKTGTRIFMSVIPSTPTSKAGTHNFISIIPSTPISITHHGSRKVLRQLEKFIGTVPSAPTSKIESRDFISITPSTPTGKDSTRDFTSIIIPSTPTTIIHHKSRKVHRQLENFTGTGPSTPTSKAGTRNVMSITPSAPTSKAGTHNFMSTIPSTPTSITHHGSRKVLRHRRLIEANGSSSPDAPGSR